MSKSLEVFVFLISLATSAFAGNNGTDSEETPIAYNNDGSSGPYLNHTTYSCSVVGAIQYLNREASGSNRIRNPKMKVFRTETIRGASLNTGQVRYYSETNKIVPQDLAPLPTGSIVIKVGEKPTDVVTIHCGHGMVVSN